MLPFIPNSNSAHLLMLIFALKEMLMLALTAGPFWNCKCTVSRRERLYNLEKVEMALKLQVLCSGVASILKLYWQLAVEQWVYNVICFLYKQTLKLFLRLFLLKLDFMTLLFRNCFNNQRVINGMTTSAQTLYKTSVVPVKLYELRLSSLYTTAEATNIIPAGSLRREKMCAFIIILVLKKLKVIFPRFIGSIKRSFPLV